MGKVEFYREKEFKKTEVGEIPKEWEVRRLGEAVLKIKAGGTPKTSIKEFYEGGNIPFVKIEDLTTNGKYLRNVSLKITERGLENSSAWLVPENSLLLAMYGSLGEVSINKIRVATNQAILGIIPNSDKLDLEYLYYWLLYFKPKWSLYAKTTTQANLTKQIVENSYIPLPPLPEQKAIAQVLKDFDDLIEVIEEKIKTLQRIKKGLMEVYFTRGVFEHKEFKDTEIGRIPKEWEVKRLGEVVKKIQYGLSKKFSDSGMYPILRMDNQHVDNIYLSFRNLKFIDLNNEELEKYKLNYGDILINRTNSIDLVGKVSLFNIKSNKIFVFASYLLRLSPIKNLIYPEYLAYFLSWDKSQRKLRDLASRSVSQANINSQNLSKLKIPLPPLEEQKAIAERLKTIDDQIENLKSQKESLQKIKKKFMDLLLTGKVRVKEIKEGAEK